MTIDFGGGKLLIKSKWLSMKGYTDWDMLQSLASFTKDIIRLPSSLRLQS